MDQQIFASLARIRILLLPVGPIRRPAFEKWATELREFTEIRLGDIPADSRDERGRFMPNPLAGGSLLLSFPSHPPSPPRAGLSVFRPSEFPLGVIGIAACSQSDALSSIYSQFNGMLSELFPANPMFPLARSCFVFEEGDGNTNLNVGNHLPGLVVIPSMMGNKQLYIGTLLAELCSNILGEFSMIVKALETPTGSEALNNALFPDLPDYRSTRSSFDVDGGYRGAHAMPAQHSQPEIIGSGLSLRASDPSRFPMKRASTLGPGSGVTGSVNRTSTLLAPATKKRQSTAGSSTSHGRLYKVLGDLFLLAGRTMDAVIWYNEAIVLLKSPPEMAWHASALDGIAVAEVIEVWSANNRLSSASSQGSESWKDISEKLAKATSLYSGVIVQPGSEESLSNLVYLYVTACLRHSSFLYCIWSAGGWSQRAFDALLQDGKGEANSAGTTDAKGGFRGHPEYFNVVAGISRSDISAALSQAHGPWLLHLGPRERVEMLRLIAGLYSRLAYRRKETYILRELLASLMDLVVQGRADTIGSSSSTPADHGLLSPDDEADSRGEIGIREKYDTEGNASILRLVKYICEVHGIDLGSVNFTEEVDNDRCIPTINPPNPPVSLPALANRYSWPDLQIGMAREALAVAEVLPDYSAVALFALSALHSLSPILDPEDQYHFYTTSARAMATAKRRGDERTIRYWPGKLVVSIRCVPLPFIRIPLGGPLSDLSAQSDTKGIGRKRGVDPFFYNPKRIMSDARQAVAVQNEIVEFRVTLQNPYSVALELSSVSLSTTGVSFQADALSVVLSANSYQTVTISGRATLPGSLIVRGCVVHLPNTEPQEILSPVLTEEEEEKEYLKNIAQACEAERAKSLSLADRFERKWGYITGNKDNRTAVSPKYLELNIVPEQPCLRIRRTSLTNGAVMLYDGESSIIRLTLENISTFPIDFLELTFEDSMRSHAEHALSEVEMNAFDTYETEYSLVRKPVFSWEPDKSRQEINAGKETMISIKCFGKAGCTDGVIQLSYAYAHRKQDNLCEPLSVFYSRQLLFPVLVTVYQMLECSSMNILPISALELSDESRGDQDRKALFRNADEYGWCVLTLDVQNTYGLPFEVTLSHNTKVCTSRVVPPGSTYRFLLPIERFSLPEKVISSPIPSLTKRQFVKTRLVGDEDKAQRELFWYREELLKRVHASWKEAAGLRVGELSLRQQRFTQPMLNALRTEAIRITLSLSEPCEEDAGDAEATPPTAVGMKCETVCNRFVSVKTCVQNLSAAPLVLNLTLNVEPSDYVACNGVLQSIPLGRLTSQESAENQTSVVFVAQGQFTVTAQVRIVELEGKGVIGGTGILAVEAYEA